MKRSTRLPSSVKVLATLAAVTGSLVFPSVATAITGGDVLDKMSSDHRAGYLAGSVEMAALMAGAQGNRERADCIMSWYYDKDGTQQVVSALTKFKDRQVLPVVLALINRACK